MVGDAETKGTAREGRSAIVVEGENEVVARSYHDTVFSGKLRQANFWATEREGGGCLLLDDQYTKTGQPVAEVLWVKYPDTRIPPVETILCAAFKEYGEVPETVPLDFT